MTPDRKERMRKMYLQGANYTEIANEFGISRQRVYQLIGGSFKTHFMGIKPKNCVYVGLREFLITNRITIAELTRRAYGIYEPVYRDRISNALKGKDVRKNVIDKILNATGLTYEQAFKRSDTE